MRYNNNNNNNNNNKSCPQPHAVIPGPPTLSPSPHIRQREKGDTSKPEQNTKANQQPTRSNPPAPYSSISSGLGSIPPPASTSPASPPSWAPGALCSGASRALAPRTLRGGGGVFHPLVSWWAILLAAQASARAPWGPPQLAHLVDPWGHGRALPTRRPSTGHRWPLVWWSLAQTAHLGWLSHSGGLCGPMHNKGCKRRLVAPPHRRRPRTVSRKAGLHSCLGD